MTSWAGTRGFAPLKKKEEAKIYYQTTDGGICSNMNLLFYSYLQAVKNTEPLYVHDVPNCVSDAFPMFQRILRVNSTVKFLKDVPPGSTRLDSSKIYATQSASSMPFNRLKQLAREFYFYNGETQGKITSLIQAAGLDRTIFDVGVHIRSGDKISTGEMKKIPMSDYVSAIRTLGSRMGKSDLKVFVMTDNPRLFQELKQASPPNWTFVTLDQMDFYNANGHNQITFNTLRSEKKEELFYLFLTELHIMQNIPNLVVTFSSNVGRFLYLTSRLVTSKENIISVDVPVWTP